MARLSMANGLSSLPKNMVATMRLSEEDNFHNKRLVIMLWFGPSEALKLARICCSPR